MTIHKSEKIDPELLQDVKVTVGKGCDKCNGSGYKGRLGLYEVLTFNDPLKEAVIEGKTTIELEKIAVRNGLTTLKQDGVMKVLKGMTTMEEIYRVANVE